jgi:hypothetical protein
MAQWTKRHGLGGQRHYNLLVAAISTLPVIVTGILAWQFQLEGQKLKGVPIPAPDTRLRLEWVDLASVVDAFPRAPAGTSPAELSPRS